ncbi:thioredoxin family protein [Lutimonas vermicola]|uniref:Thioredoxin fold domain-containing protein n=1 Tax=Lutimonas vermicola TaxID=414288 RepID=A0ABU9L585_9FLAO
MKKIVFIVAMVLFTISIEAQKGEINWISLEEAVEAQAVSPKKIMMDVYTSWCGPCKLLDRNTFQNPDVVKYVNEHYYAVKFNAEGNEKVNFKNYLFENPDYDPNRTGRNAQHQLAGALRITAYPTIVFFNESGETLLPLPGYKTPSQLELYLKLFLNNDHEKINSQEQWNQYQKDFVSQFRG